MTGMHRDFGAKVAGITEDTMPGELANVIAGRIANVFNLGGPNFITDAACASSLAALQAAVDGLTNCFKGVGRALRQAIRHEGKELPSTKGVL